nr:hypothetical protein [Tanacetum cinerariifolium]
RIGANSFVGISEDGEKGLPYGFWKALLWKKRRKMGNNVWAGKCE